MDSNTYLDIRSAIVLEVCSQQTARQQEHVFHACTGENDGTGEGKRYSYHNHPGCISPTCRSTVVLIFSL